MLTKGIASWNHLITPDNKWEEQWNILLIMDKTESDKLRSVGLKTKMDEDDDGNVIYTYRFSRKVAHKGPKGGKNPPPEIVDASLTPFTDIIGHGSVVNIKHKPYTWKNDYGTGVSTDLEAVQVLELVPYVNEDENPAVKDEGFKVESGSVSAPEESFKNETDTSADPF